MLRALDGVALLAAAVALVSTAALEARFHLTRHQVLNADAAALERLGRHLVVGYSDLDEVRALIRRRAIAALSATERARSVEPVWVRRLSMMRRKLTFAFGLP